ncbi:MAG: hypothetical protein M1835_002601 [Candelina submexicana]|nr:MAG: hypothetical protein M1835_002601 [Candelina submexicana]
MQYTTILIAASALLGSFTFAAPATEGASLASRSILNECKAAGIDPYKPIPTDYTSHENGAYHFKAGSKASKWAQAQLEIQKAPEHE